MANRQGNNRRGDDEKRYPDSIRTASGRMIRIVGRDPDEKIRLQGNHEVRVGDIPLVAARLTCGDIVRGIALRKDDVIFCEHHGEDVFVVGEA